MSSELELTAKLDALGRSLASGAPIDPPPVFMQGVRHEHRVTLVKKSALGIAAAALIVAIVMVASRQHSTPDDKNEKPAVPRRMELPAVGAMKSLVTSPDDIDDAPLLPPKAGEEAGEALPRAKDWRKEILD
jgi:hypothetical protein